MSQVNFFLSTDEVRAIILQLMDSNEVEVFNGTFFEKEYPDPIKDINEISDSKKLIFWLKNEFTRPKCSISGVGMMKGQFLFDCYKDPIIEFDNCIWTKKMMSPGRIFYKAGWIENEELRKLHKSWASRVSRLFHNGLKAIDKPWRISSSVENWVFQGGLLELGIGGKLIGKDNLNGV